MGHSQLSSRSGYEQADRGYSSVHRSILSNHLVALALALIPVLAGTSRGLLVPGLRISEVLIVGLLLLAVLRQNKRLWLGGAPFLPLVSYAALTMLVVGYHVTSRSELGLQSFLDSGIGPAVFLMLYIVGSAYGARVEVIRLILKYSFVMAGLMGVLGVAQALQVPFALNIGVRLTGNVFIANPLDWKVPRSVGIYNSWHAYASYMSIVLVLLIACYSKGVRIFRRPIVNAIVVGCVVAGLFSSLTFGMIFLGLGISAIFLWTSNKRIWILAMAAVAYVVLVFSPLSQLAIRRLQMQESTTSEYGFLPQTVAFRLSVWTRDYLPLIAQNPWFGFGPITASDRTFSYVESMYILVLLSGGLVALVAFLVFIATTILRLSPKRWRTQAEVSRAAAAGLFAFVIGLVPLMLIHPYLNDAGSSQVIFLLLGVLCAQSRRPQIAPTTSAG